MPNPADPARSDKITFRKPTAEDASAVWALIKDCPPLDVNSMYCNLVQAEHFSDTCVVAERDGEIVGWISGHMIPDEEALFVWQVAVGPKARGLGLGRRMLTHLVARDECEAAERLKTTITADNDASWGLFRSFARSIDGDLSSEPYFKRDEHFDGRHATEHMVTITLSNDMELARAA